MTATIEELRAKLAQVTDADEYDKIQAAIAQAEKESRLATNRQAVEDVAKAAATLKARLRRFEAARADLQKGRVEAADLDQGLFDDLGQLYERLLLRYQLAVSLYEKGDALNLEAEALAQPAIDNPRVSIVGVDVHGMGKFEAIGRVLAQYNDSASQIIDAKRIGKPAPAAPEMSWYGKGDGRYWPGKE